MFWKASSVRNCGLIPEMPRYRWDTPQHTLIDDADSKIGGSQIWPGIIWRPTASVETEFGYRQGL